MDSSSMYFYTAAPPILGFTFCHFANSAIGNVTPASAMANAKESFKPSMYAIKIPPMFLVGNAVRSCVAPVATTRAGLMPGAVRGTRARSRLANAVWPAETKNAPPMVWKTGCISEMEDEYMLGGVAYIE